MRTFYFLLSPLIISISFEVKSTPTKKIKNILFKVLIIVLPISSTLLLLLLLVMIAKTFFALHIVYPSFFWIWKNFISTCNFLKLCFRPFWILSILIRMVFYCKLFESFLNLVFCCILFKSHQLVIVSWWWFLSLILPIICRNSKITY